jgi:predicted transcriptional regulator YdeE
MSDKKELKIIEAGPFNAIGIRYIGKNENNEIPQLWDKDLLPRMDEIRKPAGGVAFGVCKCLPDAPEGEFEYIGAFEAAESAPVPDGMIKLTIPKAHYAVFEVPHLSQIMQAWQEAANALSEHPEIDRYCDGEKCECAEYPGFEYYPDDFNGQNRLYIYIPVKKQE